MSLFSPAPLRAFISPYATLATRALPRRRFCRYAALMLLLIAAPTRYDYAMLLRLFFFAMPYYIDMLQLLLPPLILLFSPLLYAAL